MVILVPSLFLIAIDRGVLAEPSLPPVSVQRLTFKLVREHDGRPPCAVHALACDPTAFAQGLR